MEQFATGIMGWEALDASWRCHEDLLKTYQEPFQSFLEVSWCFAASEFDFVSNEVFWGGAVRDLAVCL